MKTMRKHLERLRTVKRKKSHPLIHKIHKKYGLSKKTLLYVKEYGPHTNVPKTIIREGIETLLFASIISSFGGFMIEHVKIIFFSVLPLIILLPYLNDTIGDYGTIISSRFTTLLHERKIKGKWYRNKELRKMFLQVIIISVSMVIFSSSLALVISFLAGFGPSFGMVYKIFFITIADVILLVSILFLIAVFAGFHFYKKGEDPNNFLIPITTSIADLGNMAILSLLIVLLF